MGLSAATGGEDRVPVGEEGGGRTEDGGCTTVGLADTGFDLGVVEAGGLDTITGGIDVGAAAGGGGAPVAPTRVGTTGGPAALCAGDGALSVGGVGDGLPSV